MVILVQDEGPTLGQGIVLTGVLTGIAKQREGHLFLDRGPDLPEFPIPDEALPRIQRIAPELRGLLGGPDYAILLNGRLDSEQNDLPTRGNDAAAPETVQASFETIPVA